MRWLRLSKVDAEPEEKRELVYAQLQEQERRVRAIDFALAVIQREFDTEDGPRVDA